MRFYINETEVFVEILPQLVKAQDTTNDSFSCVLAANNRELPYEPMTPFKIVYDDDTEQTLWIISDNVSVFSTNSLAYKHSLSIVQYRYFLNKHLVRNTVFTQPREKNVKLYGAVSCALYETGSGNTYAVNYRSIPRNADLDANYWTDSLQLDSHTRVKNAHFSLKLWGIKNFNTGLTDLVQLDSISSSKPNNTRIRSTARFRLVDVNNSNYSITTFSFNDYYTEEIIISSADVDLINDYIASHNNIYLKLIYESGYTGTPTEIATAFATTVQKNVTDGFDPIEDMTYAYLTIQIEINFELYNYTMYDVVETLLKQYQLQDDTYGSKRDLLFNMPVANSELESLLKNTYAPDNLCFTQATYYEALETIFRFYDAGFKFDENKTLQIEYYNDLNRQISPSLSGRTMAFSDKDYNSGRVSYYQNALIEQNIKGINTRANTLGVPGKSDYGILVYKPIYSIRKVIMKVSGQFTVNTSGIGGGYINGTVNHLPLDLTYFVINRDIWTVLDKAGSFGGNDNTKLYQINTIPYDRGNTFICVSDYYQNWASFTFDILGNVKRYAFYRFFGIGFDQGGTWTPFANPGSTDYINQKFDIEYLAEQSGKLETQTVLPQYNGQAISNQSSGLIDLNKLGHAMFTESLKNGVPILNVNVKIDSWDNRVKEGDYIIYNGEYWVANIVEYVALGNGAYRFSIQFTKNFNLLSLRIRSDNEKRLTAISGDLAIMSEDNYIDYVYVSDQSEDAYMTMESIVLDKNILASMLAQTFKLDNSSYTIKQIDFCGISTYDMDGNLYAEDKFIPLVKYGAGNCICFEMQYNNPISAGNLLTKTTGWFGSNKYFSQAVPYTNSEGWADKITIEFYNISADGEANGFGSIPQLIPSITVEDSTINLLEKAGKLTGLKYYKKPNEIFGLNYEWCFLPVPRQLTKVFIGNKFINENFFTKPELIKGKTYYLYFVEDNSYQYSILDVKGYSGSTIVPITDIAIQVMSYDTVEVRFAVPFAYDGRTATSWAICDEDGDIYFASNNARMMFGVAAASGMKITFNTRKKRI